MIQNIKALLPSSSATARRKVAVAFAKQHKFAYFHKVDPEKEPTHLVRGSTAAPDEQDVNICIGTHNNYDIVLLERSSTISFDDYGSSSHRWYVLQVDLKRASGLPFAFIGTKQQTRAYYAKLLTMHRQLYHLVIDSKAEGNLSFHGRYVVLASPSNAHQMTKLLDKDMIDAIVGHNFPFAVEIEGDSLMVITEANKPNQQLLNRLLHYGLWFAKEIDEKLT